MLCPSVTAALLVRQIKSIGESLGNDVDQLLKVVPPLAALIAAARAAGIMVIHTREADAEMAAILREEQGRGPFKFLMHCYTSGMELAETAMELGGWFSVSGIASFKAAEDVRQVIRAMPADRIIVETDCPYLAPTPYRGRRNEPAYVARVLETLAEVRGWSMAEATQRTTDAFFNLFHTVPRPEVGS